MLTPCTCRTGTESAHMYVGNQTSWRKLIQKGLTFWKPLHSVQCPLCQTLGQHSYTYSTEQKALKLLLNADEDTPQFHQRMVSALLEREISVHRREGLALWRPVGKKLDDPRHAAVSRQFILDTHGKHTIFKKRTGHNCVFHQHPNLYHQLFHLYSHQ